MELIKLDPFVSMIEEGEPFAGGRLTAVLRGKTNCVMETFVCSRVNQPQTKTLKRMLDRPASIVTGYTVRGLFTAMVTASI